MKENTMIVPILILLSVAGFSLEMGFQDGQQRPDDKSFFVSGD